MISETKIDETFPESQFLIDGYSSPYRLDRTSKGGGLLLYIRSDIPSKRIKTNLQLNTFEGFFIELNLKNKKRVLACSYNPHKHMVVSHLEIKSNFLSAINCKYEHFILIGDYNAEVKEPQLAQFMSIYNLKNLVKHDTCFKNPENPSCI